MPSPHSTQPVALVTGAGSGIGLATASMLAREGYRVALVGRSLARLEDAAMRINTADGALDPKHPRAIALEADLAEPTRCPWVVGKAAGVFGRLDVVVSNAGWTPLAPIPAMDPGTAGHIFAINALAPVYLTLAACNQFESQARSVPVQSGRRPCIVSVSSQASIDPFPGLGVYGAAKAAVNTLALATARECPGVRAFAVAPGAVETPLLRSIFPESDLPRERCLQPADVARVILDCVLGAYDDQNGRTIHVPSH